jgi:hypothetical protein
MSKRGDDTISWDDWGRMSGGSFDTKTVSYAFDPLGRRRSRVSAGVTTQYRFAGPGEAALFETTSAGAIQLTDVDGPAGDLAQYAGPPTSQSTVSYLHYNGYGDLAASIDDSGSRTGANTYDEFGAPRQSQPVSTAVECWTGRWDKQYDTHTSLVKWACALMTRNLGDSLPPIRSMGVR